MSTPDDPDAPEPKRQYRPTAGNIVDLSTGARRKKAKSRMLKGKAKGTTLCSSGFHKWQIDQRKQFDVQAGKLITIKRCSRCGQTKTLAT